MCLATELIFDDVFLKLDFIDSGHSEKALVSVILHIHFLNSFGDCLVLTNDIEVVVVQVPVNEYKVAGVKPDYRVRLVF